MTIAQTGKIGILLLILAAAMFVLSGPIIIATGHLITTVDSLSNTNYQISQAQQTAELATIWDAQIDEILTRAVIIDPNYSHALEEHPETAQIVRDCFATKGQYMAFQIEPKKRYLRVCLVTDSTIGFQIVDIVGKKAMEKTAYIKDTIKCLKELFDYARKMGYPRFTKLF